MSVVVKCIHATPPKKDGSELGEGVGVDDGGSPIFPRPGPDLERSAVDEANAMIGRDDPSAYVRNDRSTFGPTTTAKEDDAGSQDPMKKLEDDPAANVNTGDVDAILKLASSLSRDAAQMDQADKIREEDNLKALNSEAISSQKKAALATGQLHSKLEKLAITPIEDLDPVRSLGEAQRKLENCWNMRKKFCGPIPNMH